MRILFFSEQFWPETNAPAIHVHGRARIWARQGHHVTVITSAPNFPEGKLFPGYRNAWRSIEIVDGIRVVRVKTFIRPNRGILSRAMDFGSYFLSALIVSFLEERSDVVISTSPQLLVPLAGVLHAKIRRIPHVFELRDLWPAAITAVGAARPGVALRLLERMELHLYLASVRVIAFTEAFRKDLIRRQIPDGHVVVVPNGTDLEAFYPRPKDVNLLKTLGLEQRFVVGYIGTLGMAHGLGNLIETAKLLEDTPITFLLAGPGAAKEELEQLARKEGLSNMVFLPRQPREAMPALWSICDVALVHLKDTEVFKTVIPSKIYEAAAMGIPVCFAGPEGEGSALVESFGIGVTLPAEQPGPLAKALRDLWQDENRRTRFVARAEAARANFSRETQASLTLSILSQAASS